MIGSSSLSEITPPSLRIICLGPRSLRLELCSTRTAPSSARLQFRGPDLDSATPSELMGASVRLNNALRRFGSGWCFHVEARRAPAPGYPDAVWPNALSWLIDEERRAVFETAGARFESHTF